MTRPVSSEEPEARPHPALVFLSGRQRGAHRFLEADRVTVGTSSACDIVVAGPPAAAGPGNDGEQASPPATLEQGASTADDRPEGLLAILHHRGHTYEIEAVGGPPVRVDGDRVERLVLAGGDIVEIGGEVMRFRLYPHSRGRYKSMSEAFTDCLDSARHAGDNPVARAGIFLANVPRELGGRTAPTARFGFWLLMVGVVATLGALLVRNVQLSEQLAAESRRVEGLAELLEESESESFSPAELEAAQADVEARLEALEALAAAPERVIAAAERSVVFLQGAYGFVDPDSGRPLRFRVGRDGRPIRRPDAVTLDGPGPEVELFYTGTGFVVTEDGHMLTNRHVAQPWRYDENAQRVISQGLEPTMRRFIGYLPGLAEPFDVRFVAASDDADLALLHCDAPARLVMPLALDPEPPAQGSQVILMGYPAGIPALMARAGQQFASEIEADGPVGFWEIVRRLAAAGHIEPLPTQGIVGQTTEAAIVYDAQTTSGGSGGPLMDLEGNVVAINAAVVRDFGGSNLGVPARRALELMETALRNEPDGR